MHDRDTRNRVTTGQTTDRLTDQQSNQSTTRAGRRRGAASRRTVVPVGRRSSASSMHAVRVSECLRDSRPRSVVNWWTR